MQILGVIPARFGATRFPGKPLTKILNKTLVQWVIEGSLKSKELTGVLLATDHDEIADIGRRLGIEAIMTDPNLPSGSDRIWAAVKDRQCDVVVNIQGDEPLVDGDLIDSLVRPMISRPKLAMSTLARTLLAEELSNPQSVKVVVDKDGHAIYFSRFGIPYSRLGYQDCPGIAMKHIGMYAYRRDLLREFCEMGPTSIEKCEGLEQLRALYMGAKIRVVETTHESWGVDVPSDIAKVEKLLSLKDRA